MSKQKRSGRRSLALAVSAVALLPLSLQASADTAQTVNSGSTDLTSGNSYTPNTTPNSTTDVIFSGTYSPTAFTINSALNIATLNDLGTPALTTRGMAEEEMRMIAGWVADALEHRSGLLGLAGTADMREVLARDDDAFNRWEAGQRLGASIILEKRGQPSPAFIDAMGSMLREKDQIFAAEVLALRYDWRGNAPVFVHNLGAIPREIPFKPGAEGLHDSLLVNLLSAENSMPVFAAWTPMSSTTTLICSRIRDGGRSRMSVTPIVFCAVIAVMADVPWTPRTANVLRSACMPAPPPESEPAMVSATGSFMRA